MNRIAKILIVSFLLVSLPAAAGVFKNAPKNGVPDQYLVVLADGVSKKPYGPPSDLPEPAQVARTLGKAYGGEIQEVWEHALQGFLVRMPEARARKLAQDPRVKSVEQNFFISAPVGDCYYEGYWDDPRTTLPSTSPQTINCTDPDPVNDTDPDDPPNCQDNWGLDRIDQTNWARNGLFSWVNNGNGGGTTVHVYVLDTGIQWDHREFLNTSGVTRVSGGANALDAPAVAGTAANTDDCYGHGTHVAAIIGGRTFGVAKNVALHPVRIIGCRGTSNATFADRVVRGLNWIRDNAQRPAVINWSGANDPSFVTNQAMRDAVSGVVNANPPIILVQAAGNSSTEYDSSDPNSIRDSCDWSYGNEFPQVIVAGGMSHQDGRWTRRPAIDPMDLEYCNPNTYPPRLDCGSNGGSCVDIWAPAEHIVSANMDATNAACRLSGTSMAAPHVAGAVAAYLQSNPSATATQVERALRSRGTWNLLDASTSSVNYIGWDADNVILFSDTRSTGDWAPTAGFNVTCPGRQCVFTGAGSDDVTVSSYAWRFDDGGTDSGSTVRHTFATSGTHTAVVRVTDNTGKTDHLRQTFTVNTNNPPVADFDSSCVARTCNFTSTSTDSDGSISSYSWNFGDSTTSTAANPSHTYATSGSFVVTLTVTDNSAQTGTHSETVLVDFAAPTGVTALASGTTVTISWNTVAGADGYELWRKTSSAAYTLAKTVSGGSSSQTTDTPPSSANGVVLYYVVAKSGTSSSAPSNVDVAFVGTLVDPIVTPQSTIVKADHITQIRAAVNGLRALAGQSDIYSASDVDPAVLRQQMVDDAHWTTLMTNLSNARQGVQLGICSWGGNPPAASVIIDDAHLNALRNCLK